MNNKLLLSSFRFQAGGFYGPDVDINNVPPNTAQIIRLVFFVYECFKYIFYLYSWRFKLLCFLRKYYLRESLGWRVGVGVLRTH